jgi:hypothetical protein
LSPPSSGTPQSQEKLPEPLLFFEESLGKKIAEVLSGRGIRVKTHMEEFPAGTPDDVWIPRCAANGWVIISKDARIRRRPVELHAIRISGARFFYFAYGQAKSQDYAESLSRAYPSIVRAFENRPPPFIGRISPSGDIQFIEF